MANLNRSWHGNNSRSPPTQPTVLLVPHAKDDLGGAVVPGDYVGRHHEAGTGRPCQAKVKNLQRAVGLDDNV